MIDWVTARLPCTNTGDICDGKVIKLNADDSEIEWTTQTRLSLTGSHDSSISIRSLTENTIEILGNPAKWLQGHNLFGSNDLRLLMWVFFNRLIEFYDIGLNPTIQDLERIKEGRYTVSRVDINETWLLKNKAEVMAWIRSAGEKVSMPYRGKGVFSGDTLYWGKGSKYFYLKCYSKGDEINRKKSNFPDALRIPQMLEYAECSLRLELVLCSNFLRTTHLNMPCDWLLDTPKMLLTSHVRSLEMSSQFILSDEVLDTLPRKLRLYYKAWLSGEDLRLELSKPTFYRIRKQLKEYDIDIALVRDVEKPLNNVVPLIRVLEAEPVGIPDWAYEKNLVAC
jgi:II/X family phage/plasmid replication protein